MCLAACFASCGNGYSDLKEEKQKKQDEKYKIEIPDDIHNSIEDLADSLDRYVESEKEKTKDKLSQEATASPEDMERLADIYNAVKE